jgi:DNA-directed RNA polymerase II subunit RPB2
MVLDHDDSEWDLLHAAQREADEHILRAGANVCKLTLNGILLGFVPDIKHAAHVLRLARRRRVIPFDVAIEENAQREQLCITAEAGGIRRPLFVMSPEGNLDHVRELYAKCAELPKDAFWKRLVQEGYVEYLSKHEEENTLVLASPCTLVKLNAPLTEHTHCEIHPSFMLGIAASTIPFSDHNQAPRTSYFASMCKQTAGSPPPDMAYTNGMRLMYAQKPLVTTWGSLIHGTYDQPTGMNIWIAVSAAGLNQEDSLILNEDSKSRGLFACAVTKTYNEDCQSGNGADSQHFERPSECKLPRYGNVSKMNPQGYVNPGEAVRGGDAIIGRTMNVNDITCIKRNTVKQDQTTMLPNRDKWSEVNAVLRCVGRDDREMISMRTHTMRFLQTGDKLTSQHGQKGIVGCLRPARDMPYTQDGIIADALINPHAFPSRMTVGHLLETALGLACAHNGETADGTPFNGVSAADVEAELKALGFDSAGEQVMYDGESGKRINVMMFFGCAYYLRVKQMVEDKHHARAHGPVHILTQQPVEGRSKEGGFRVGDMERECLQAYGAANVTWDRLFQQSDYAEVPVCTSCRMLAMPRAPLDQRYLIVGSNELAGFCHVCKQPGSVVNVPMPFATKLWHFELMAYHVRVEHALDPRPDINPFTTAAVGMRKKDLHEEENLLRPEFKASVWMGSKNKKRGRPEEETDDTVHHLPDGFMEEMDGGAVSDFDFGVDDLDCD